MTPSRPWLAVLVVALLAGAARAAEVAVEVSSRRVDVGIPFSLVIEVVSTDSHEPPTLPEMDGLEVVGSPARSERSFTSIVNGRTSRRDSIFYTFTIVATKAGPLEIPALRVVADGEAFVSAPIALVAERPENTGLLYAEIVAAKPTVRLGEPVALTLRIDIRPYEEERLDVVLSSDSMWSQIDLSRSRWGDFTDALRDVPGRMRRRGRMPAERVVRPDPNGQDATYYRYELAAELWPEQSGPIEIAPVAVVMEYPTRLERGFFARDLKLAEARTIVAAAEVPAIEVLAPPAEGRPPFFNGAVGRYDIEVTALPTEVAVGDPITLRITLTDRTPRGSRLDLLPPPPLAAFPALTDDFRVPSDPLAGVVDGRTKTFTQTIRARRDDVKAIPAIPYAFFDPAEERYVTVGSDPIGLSVRPAAALSMTDVVGAAPALPPEASSLTEVAGGLLANVSRPERLLATGSPLPGWGHAALVLAPPALFGLVAVRHRRAARRREDRAYERRRGARRTARRRLASARAATGRAQAEQVATALSGYVADRCGAPAGSLTPAEVVSRIRDSGAAADLVREVETLLAECEQSRFAGTAGGGENGRADRAMRCIDRLERERIG